MPLDPNIPLSAGKQPSFAQQAGQVYQLAGAVEKQQQYQEQKQDQQAIQEALKAGADFKTPDGIFATAEQLKGKVSPGAYQTILTAGEEMKANEVKKQEAMARLGPERLQMFKAQNDVMSQTLQQIIAGNDEDVKQFGSQEANTNLFEKRKQDAIQRLGAVKLPDGTPAVPPQFLQELAGMNRAQMETAFKNSQYGQEQLDKTLERSLKVAQIAHEERLAKGLPLTGTSPTGLPAKGWKFVRSSDGMFRANPNAGIVQMIDPETQEWRQARPDELPPDVIESLGGSKAVSAITDRLNKRTMTAAAEVSRGLKMVAQMPIGTTEGIFNYDKPSGIESALKRKLTDEDSLDYNTAVSAMGLELTTLLRGGMQITDAEIKEIKDGMTAKPGMTVGNLRYQFASSVAKTLTALESFEPTSKQQEELKKKYISELSKYPTPEQVYEENRTGRIKKRTMGESLEETKARVTAKEGKPGAAPSPYFTDPEKQRRYEEWKKAKGK